MPITESHVRGATDIPLIETTIGAFFDEATERLAEHDALVVRHQGIRWTYGELRKQVDAFAAGLLTLGLQPGERVGIWSPNNVEWVITQFATAKAGLILVTINPPAIDWASWNTPSPTAAAAPQLITATQHSRPATISRMLNTLAPEIAGCAPGKLVAAKVPSLKTLICIGADAPGFVRFDVVPAMATARHHDELATLGGETEEHGSHQHPIHQRHHGLAEGRHPQPSQHPQQRVLRRPHDAPHGR